jgi:hypothetical protein
MIKVGLVSNEQSMQFYVLLSVKELIHIRGSSSLPPTPGLADLSFIFLSCTLVYNVKRLAYYESTYTIRHLT